MRTQSAIRQKDMGHRTCVSIALLSVRVSESVFVSLCVCVCVCWASATWSFAYNYKQVIDINRPTAASKPLPCPVLFLAIQESTMPKKTQTADTTGCAG